MNNSLLKTIEALVNRGLALDQDSVKALEAMTGKVIALEFINTGLEFYLFPCADGLRIRDEAEDEAHVRIMATLPDMLSYLASSAGDAVSSSGTLQVVGDVGLAQRFQGIIRNTDLDWEELLSRYTGDIIARKLGNLVREAGRFGGHTGMTLRENIREYLLYEKEALPLNEDVDNYISSVDELRDDVERLRMRIDRLARITAAGT